jgi:hypothetical protein
MLLFVLGVLCITGGIVVFVKTALPFYIALMIIVTGLVMIVAAFNQPE